MGATDLSVLPQRQVVFPETVFRSSATTDVPLRVQGIASQSGNLTEWQNDTGANLLSVESNGLIRLNVSSPTGDAWLNYGATGAPTNRLRPFAASTQGLVIMGMTSQTANMQEWQDSAGGLLARVNNSGGGAFGMVATGNYGTTFGGVADYASLVRVNSLQAAVAGLTVRGAVSQTAPLLELQDSAGVGLAHFSPSGQLTQSSTTPLHFTSLGTGTYNRTVIYNNSAGLSLDIARATDATTGTPLPLIIANRGGGGEVRILTGRVYDNGFQHAIIVGQHIMLAPGQDSAPNGAPARWDGTNFWWSGRILLLGAGRGTHHSVSGHYSFTMPAATTVITGHGGAVNQTVTAAGIPIPAHTALYAEVGVAGGGASSYTYRLVGYTADFVVPNNWILIASYTENQNSGKLKTGWGAVLDSWKGFAYLNGHSSYDYGGTAAYYRDGEGIVHVQGLITKAGNASPFATMPVGYRPSRNIIISAMTSSGAMELRLENNGNFFFNNTTAAAWGSIFLSYMAAN